MNWLVVGLGNPGPTYARHRHNVGFLVADALAARTADRFSAPRGMRAEISETRLGSAPFGDEADRIVLVKPRTFMNESGIAVQKAAAFFKIPPKRLIVIHDELDLDPGQLRVKFGGGDNGHNGLKSIRAHLGTGEFYRIRFGIGRPPGRQPAADFVLSPFPAAQAQELALEVNRAAEAVESVIRHGLTATQNQFNS